MEPEPMVENEFSLPLRPASSSTTLGKPISLTTNYFKFSMDVSKNLYLYSVDITPELPPDSRSLYKMIMTAAHPQLKTQLKLYHYFGRNIISNGLITVGEKIPVKLQEQDYCITLLLAKSMNVETLLKFKDTKEAQIIKTFFNSLIKSHLSELKMIELGRSQKYFDIRSIKKVSNYDIEVWTGYKTTVNLCENNAIYLQIDYASRCLNTTTVLSYLTNLQSRGFSNADIKEEIKDKTVIARYGNYRLYKISDIEFNNNPKTKTFQFRDNPNISIAEYMQQAYNVKIKEVNQPLLISIVEPKVRRGRSAPTGQKLESKMVYLVPELCYMTGITDELKNDHEFMKPLSEYTKLEPQKRVDKYKDLLQQFERLSLSGTSPVAQWGVKINPVPLNITGTLLPPPTLLLGKGKSVQLDNRGTFMLKEEIFAPLSLRKWVFLHTSRDEEFASEMVETMKRASRVYGINVSDPKYVQVQGMKAVNYVSAVDSTQGADIYVFLLPPPAKSEYGRIKAEMLKRGLLSQVIISKKQKNLMSVASKIILQINAKCKGILWKINTKIAKSLDRATMIVGVDLSTDKGKTVMAFTSSYDPAMMCYYSQIKKLDAGQSISESMTEFMAKALDFFYVSTQSKFYPGMVFLYREGVGDSQTENLFKYEVSSCLEAINKLGKKIKFSYTVMNKKISIRAFVSGGQDKRGGYSQMLSNSPCGTLIDTTILSDKYEFLIQPQFVNQGTGTPTQFRVLYDTTALPKEEYQNLTYNLCYGYQNWMGGIRTPAPTMYAAKLAKLVVKSAKNQEPKSNLNSLLHYL
jgi:aubergine-like protein